MIIAAAQTKPVNNNTAQNIEDHIRHGITEAYEQLNNYASMYSMNILMSNFGGPSYSFESTGCSAFWSNTGELLYRIEDQGEALLVVRTKNTNR